MSLEFDASDREDGKMPEAAEAKDKFIGRPVTFDSESLVELEFQKQEREDHEHEVWSLAKFMHEVYEDTAKEKGWDTQATCKIEFDELPERNRATMLIVAENVLEKLRQ